MTLKDKLINIAENSNDDEMANSAMQQLKRDFDKTYHWCPDWDFMVVCATDPEAGGCTCEITKGKGRRKL